MLSVRLGLFTVRNQLHLTANPVFRRVDIMKDTIRTTHILKMTFINMIDIKY